MCWTSPPKQGEGVAGRPGWGDDQRVGIDARPYRQPRPPFGRQCGVLGRALAEEEAHLGVGIGARGGGRGGGCAAGQREELVLQPAVVAAALRQLADRAE